MTKPTFNTGDVPSANQVNVWMVNLLVALKASDETVTSSTTLQDDNDITVAVEANAFYKIDIFILYTANTTADLKWQLQAPAGANADFAISRISPAAADITGDVADNYGLNTDIQCGGLNTNTACFGMGLFKTAGTAGNVKIQWAQNTSNAGGTVVHADSFLVLTRIS